MPRGGNEDDGFVIRDEASEKALAQIPGDERIGLDSKRRELSKALLVIIVGGIVDPGQEGAAWHRHLTRGEKCTIVSFLATRFEP
jgi:hypothetical protein